MTGINGASNAGKDQEELPEGLRLWVVLDADGEPIAEGRAAGTWRPMKTMFAVMGAQPDGEEVSGMLLNCDTDSVARFERIEPGCYRELFV